MRGSAVLPAAVAVLGTIAPVVLAQQYEGTHENNTLPSVDGARVEYFRIKDSQDRNATLIVCPSPFFSESFAERRPAELLFP